MNRIKPPAMPKPLLDLYADLRERRLLPLVAVLAIAIVAVPLALSSSGAEVPPADTDAEVLPASDNGAPAVVVSDPGVRDPQRRLGDRSKKNPFRQVFASRDASGGGQAAAAPAGGEAPAGGGGGESPAPPSGGSPFLPGPTSDPGPPAPDGGDPDTSPDGNAEEPAYEVVVRAGPAGEVSSRKLSEPTALPGEVRPLAVFTGLSEDGRQAVFRITGQTTAVYGEADCLAGTDRCTRIAIAPGDGVNLVHGENEDVYRLVVVRVERNR